MLDLDPETLGIDPETLASWYADLLSSRSGHRPVLTADEWRLHRAGHPDFEPPPRIRRIASPRWDPAVSPQVLSHWLSLADRLPAAVDEARGLAFLQSLHALGARPGWPGDDRLPKTGGSGPLQLPTWRSSSPAHPTPIPLAAWQEAASRAVQKGLLSAPSSPFNHSPSLRDLQITTPGSGPEILRFASLLASAAGLPPDASLAPPLPEIDRPTPRAPHNVRVASDNAPRLPFPPWSIKAAPSPITIETIAEASRLFRLLESDPSTAAPPTRSPVPQPKGDLPPPELLGDETGQRERTSFRPPTPMVRLAYRTRAHDYLRAWNDAPDDIRMSLPDPRTIPDPDTLMSNDEMSSAASRLSHLASIARGGNPTLATSGLPVHRALSRDAARERLRIAHSPKRPNPLQEIEDLAQALRTPRADPDDGSPPVPERITHDRRDDDRPIPPARPDKDRDPNTPVTPPHRGTRGGQSMGATRGRNLARKVEAGRRSKGPGGAAVNRIWQSWEDLGTAFPPASGDLEGNARAPSPKGGEAHIVKERQKPVNHSSTRSVATKMGRKALGRLAAMFMLGIARGMK